MIPTHSHHYENRIKAVHEAWATKCDKYMFVIVMPIEWKNKTKQIINNETIVKGFEFEYENIQFLQPPNFTFDIYNKLTDKVYRAFEYIYKNYNDYDFYLKGDDDTFIFVDNLRKFLSRQNRSSPVTFGWDLSCYVSGGYHSGGDKNKFIINELYPGNLLRALITRNYDIFTRFWVQLRVITSKAVIFYDLITTLSRNHKL